MGLVSVGLVPLLRWCTVLYPGMSAKRGGGRIPLYPCPCGCGEKFSTGNGAIMHAVNSEDSDHAGVSVHCEAYEALTARIRDGEVL